MWRIYYGNGRIVTSADHTPESLKHWQVFNIQAIVQGCEETDWFIESGRDFYVWDTRGEVTRWWGLDEPGYYGYLEKPGWKKIIIGEMTSEENFNTVIRQASLDVQSLREKGYIEEP